MEIKEQLEKEYEKIDIDLLKDLNSSLKVKGYLLLILLDYRKNIKIINEELVSNINVKRLEKFLKQTNKDTSKIEEFKEKNDKILEEAIELTTTNFDYCMQMLKVTDRNNYKEVLRLAAFSTLSFNNNLGYLNEKRIATECLYKDMEYEEYKYKDLRKETAEIINEKLAFLNENKKSKNNKQYTRK